MAASSGASVIPRKDGLYDKYIRNHQILSQSQLKRVMEHKYSAEGTSILEPPMQIFWRWLVEQIPRWWAPNAITLIGLLINVSTTLILCFYSPDCIQEAPRWAFFLSGIGLFVYQTLDAIDGKQARRTQSNSPLGELFDHGCDSVSMGVVILGCSIALQLGDSPGYMLYQNLYSYFLFYMAHWRTYVCGSLRFSKVDVTEGQFSVIAIYFISGIFGSGVWSYEIPAFGIPLKLVPVYISLAVSIFQVWSAFHIICMNGGVGKNGSTVAGTSTVFPMFPILAVVIPAIVIANKSPSLVFNHNPCLYLLAFSVLAAKVTNRLVVAHMTKSAMDFWDTCFLGPAMLFFNQYFNCWFDEYYVLWLCLIWNMADLARYCTIVCEEICHCLQIYCFTITSRPVYRNNTRNGSMKK